MDKDTGALNFDDIRPLTNDEVKAALDELAGNEDLARAFRYIKPDLDWEQFGDVIRSCRTKEEFKSTLSYEVVNMIARNTTQSLTISGGEHLPADKSPCTFISNHRDIVLDACFLNVMLYEVGYGMTQVAIGDNLLIRPWIKTLVQLNNSFIVKRSVSVRQKLEESKKLSAYIHHTIKETKESVWIAQREGRAKDSNDKTQSSILKMFNMSGEEDILSNIMSLNIVPVSISYEYDPCDFLKAQEFQLKRDNPDFVKSQRDDLLNMETGILNDKGNVKFVVANPINPIISQFDPTTEKNELYSAIANAIDVEIYKHYTFYPGNYVAYDLLHGSARFTDKYTSGEKAAFEAYLQGQIDKIVIPDKDTLFLRTKILQMYANPLINNLSVTS